MIVSDSVRFIEFRIHEKKYEKKSSTNKCIIIQHILYICMHITCHIRNLLDAHRNNKVGNIHWHLKMNEKTINSVDQCVPAESDVFSPQT